MKHIPTSPEFEACCREAFSFLLNQGFVLEADAEFSRRFCGPAFDVVVQGEGYGTVAAVSLTKPSGQVPLTLLFPQPVRERPPKGQLQQIRFFATQLQTHCADLMEGRTERLHQAQAEWTRTTSKRSRQRPAG